MELDWNDLRFFLAVARGGTLKQAATTLDVDDTTVGRRISSLESRLGVELFARSPTGLTLSAAGARIVDAAEHMEDAALAVSAAAAGEGAALAGTVRVATTETLAEAFVVPAVHALRARHPRVQVVIATGWQRVDLRRGEADLAVRLVRPTDPRLAARKLATFSLRLYASPAYIAARGRPTSLDGHALLAYEDAIRFAGRHPFANLPMERGELVLLSNSHHTLLTSAIAGLGIVQLPSYVGDAQPELTRILPDAEQRYDVWLVVPQVRRRIATVRAVGDAIVAKFKNR